jgi:xanthine dehydrogenase small subunit
LADALSGNLCRCTGYRPILDAAQQMLAQTGPRLPLAGLRDQLLALQAAPALGGRLCTPARPGHAGPAAGRQARGPAGGRRHRRGPVGDQADAPLGELIFLGDVAELRRIEATATALRIGAAVTLEDAWAALVARWPALHEMHRRFAGPRCATPARWWATWPTARPSATAPRC